MLIAERGSLNKVRHFSSMCQDVLEGFNSCEVGYKVMSIAKFIVANEGLGMYEDLLYHFNSHSVEGQTLTTWLRKVSMRGALGLSPQHLNSLNSLTIEEFAREYRDSLTVSQVESMYLAVAYYMIQLEV